MAARGRPAALNQIIDPVEIIPIEYIVDNLQNLTHRMLCDQTRENIIIWLVRHGLLRNSYECPNCHNLCRYIQSSHFNDENEWRCRDCNVKKSIRVGSFFESSHLTLYQIIDFLYFWSRKLLLKDISEEVNVGTHAAVEWANIIRDICGLWCIDQQEQIGGEGKVVEIDESKWMHRKYHRGEWKEGIWVFGNISLQFILLLLLVF